MEYDKDVINGVASGDDQTADYVDQATGLNPKIEVLEREKKKLIEENEEIKGKVKELSVEIEGLKSEEEALKERLKELEKEIERSEEVNKALAARDQDLETEVSRLQHDLITAVNGAAETNSELLQLKRNLGEKEEKVLALEKEVETLKNTKVESEKKVRELERKVGILEVKEIEEKSKKVRVEEEMRDKIDEKEKEITSFKKKIDNLESTILKNGLEFEKWIKEKLNMEELLKESKEKTKTLELNMFQLEKEVEEAHKVIDGLKEKAVSALNGTAEELKAAFDDAETEMKLNWPVIAGSTGAIAATAALVFVFYGRQR